jgi:RsiW-degrading membrane proteinase PrsW (M82 family)
LALYAQSDRLLMGSPLRRRGVCLVTIAAAIIVLAFATIVHLGLIGGMRADVMAVYLQALVLSSLLSAVPLAVLWYLDRRERETPWLFAAAFLWGGCIATTLALPVNTAFFLFVDTIVAQEPAIREVLGPDAAMLLAAPISAPIAEEIAKALGVLVLFSFLRAEFDNMRDGIVYGALVGAGFNWFEAALYVAQNYAEHGVATYGLQLGARYALFGLGGHAMFTAIFGAFLGFATQTQYRWLRVLAPLAGLTLAIAAHMLYNILPLVAALESAGAGEPARSEPFPDMGFVETFVSSSLLQLVIFLPFLLILAIALWRSGAWERRVIRDELADEVGRTVSADEYRDIVGDRMFRTRRIDRLRPHVSAALVNAQHELAFRKRHVRDAGENPEHDPLIAGWREEIGRLREMV